jgi:hypothetical protein
VPPLKKDASFRLIVTGKIGLKEIDRPVEKLQIDKEILEKEILADQDNALSEHDVIADEQPSKPSWRRFQMKEAVN